MIAWLSTAELPRLSEVAGWPSVAILVLPNDYKPDENTRFGQRNVILAQAITSTSILPIAPWAQAVILDMENDGRFSDFTQGLSLPIFARRTLPGPTDITSARLACDALQRDLAGLKSFTGPIEFAGYLV